MIRCPVCNGSGKQFARPIPGATPYQPCTRCMGRGLLVDVPPATVGPLDLLGAPLFLDGAIAQATRAVQQDMAEYIARTHRQAEFVGLDDLPSRRKPQLAEANPNDFMEGGIEIEDLNQGPPPRPRPKARPEPEAEPETTARQSWPKRVAASVLVWLMGILFTQEKGVP